MRTDATDAERKLWQRIRQKQLNGHRFRRQVPIGGYIVDFYCVAARLAIELDGGQHLDPENLMRDQHRDEILKSLGVRTLRFSDIDVLRDIDAVLIEITKTIELLHDTLLFVYGTLLPGEAPAGMKEIADQLLPVGRATIQAKLYDFGDYPGVVLSAEDARVQGQLVRVPTENLWIQLDAYEACPLPDSEDGLFRRVKTHALVESSEAVDCWVYVYNRSVDSAALVESGQWRGRRYRDVAK
jgi:very-short-patch-repair endonuclease/gamma-glutamylcyclotransferase (GGCT)/AIG2-like uncharacterized protein YtfP